MSSPRNLPPLSTTPATTFGRSSLHPMTPHPSSQLRYTPASTRTFTHTATRTRTGTRTLTGTRTRTQSRRTRTGTTASRARTATGVEDLYMVACIENRAREIGVAAYNMRSFDVELRQFTDTNTFMTTLTLLTVFAPAEIVLSTSSSNGIMHNTIKYSPYFAHTKISFIPRRFFNETTGAVFIERLSATPCPNLAASSNLPKYLAISACGALLKYIETMQNQGFQLKTLRIRLQENEGILSLDVSTIEALELVRNLRAHSAANPRLRKETLLGVLDKTKTRPGRRLLRKSLLEPSSSLETIKCRQDVVDQMIENDEMFFGVTDALTRLPDLEATLASLIHKQRELVRNFRSEQEELDADSATTAAASIRNKLAETLEPPNMNTIRNLLLVKKTIEALPKILEAIERTDVLILRAIAETLRSKPLDSLRELIYDVFEDDAMPNAKSEQMRLQSAFAVRTGRNGILDVARKTLSENISDMHSHLETVKERYDLTKLSIAYNVSRGYHFTISAKMLNMDQLPDDFVQFQKGRLTKFSTEVMIELNARYRESLNEIWLLSNREVSTVLEFCWKQEVISELHRLCDAIALLDVLTSFVSYISMSPHRHARPTFSKSGAIAIKSAHNVILASLRSSESVPNDMFLSETSSFHLISGPNMAGKSTLIKAVGLMVILAHIGCFVPADYASMRLLQRMCTRIGTGDSVEHNQSSFSREMTEMANILKLLSNVSRPSSISLSDQRQDVDPKHVWSSQNSLVLVDELGRATAPIDGFALAYALAEDLSFHSRTFVLLTTHFAGMSELENFNPSVKSFHLQVEDQEPSGQKFTGGNAEDSEESHHNKQKADTTRSDSRAKRFTYRVAPGMTTAKNYGLLTAAAAGLPSSIIEDAHRLSQMFPEGYLGTSKSSNSDVTICGRRASRVRVIHGLAERLCILRHASLSEESFRTHLKALQERIRTACRVASAGEASPRR